MCRSCYCIIQQHNLEHARIITIPTTEHPTTAGPNPTKTRTPSVEITASLKTQDSTSTICPSIDILTAIDTADEVPELEGGGGACIQVWVRVQLRVRGHDTVRRLHLTPARAPWGFGLSTIPSWVWDSALSKSPNDPSSSNCAHECLSQGGRGEAKAGGWMDPRVRRGGRKECIGARGSRAGKRARVSSLPGIEWATS